MRDVNLKAMRLLLEGRDVKPYGEHEFTVNPFKSYDVPMKMVWPDQVYYHPNREMFLPGETRMVEHLTPLLEVLGLPMDHPLGLGTGELLPTAAAEDDTMLFRLKPAEFAKHLLVCVFHPSGFKVPEKLPEEYGQHAFYQAESPRASCNFLLAQENGATLYVLERNAKTEEFFKTIEAEDKRSIAESERAEVKYQQNKARFRERVKRTLEPKLAALWLNHRVEYEDDFWCISWQPVLQSERVYICMAYNEEGMQRGQKYIKDVVQSTVNAIDLARTLK